jgi:signal transduction histidine kinase
VHLDQLTEQQLASGEQVRLLRRPFAESTGSVIVGISTLPLQQTSRNILLALAIATPLVLALSAMGGLFLAGRALKPIASITAQARRIGRDNLTHRLALTGPRDEVRELAQVFDEMLDRLQAAFEGEQRFTSDASHELRTPLGLLKAQITLALARPRDAQALTKMVQAMEGYVDRMTRLIETMLSLARTGEPLNQHVRVDLVDLLGGLAEQMQTAHVSRRIQFSLDAPPALNAHVLGDPDRLTQLFMNLLDNAAKYSSESCSVRISVKSQDAGWAIDMADEGIGIAPEHLTHVFDRFYRTDASRARQTGGIGLGLPIAQAIAKQHGGRITVQSMLDSGSVFTVWLPKS